MSPTRLPYYSCLAFSAALLACGGSLPISDQGELPQSAQSALVLSDLICSGENYDVNGKAGDGCEERHEGAHHTSTTALLLGAMTCYDGLGKTLRGTILSDSRVHDPAPAAFDTTVGSAPDFYLVYTTGGGFCINDGDFFIQTSGGGLAPCYEFTVITDKVTSSVLLNGQDNGRISLGFGAYHDNSLVFIKAEKKCKLTIQEAVRYTINFHL